jgi:hypothetical protein
MALFGAFAFASTDRVASLRGDFMKAGERSGAAASGVSGGTTATVGSGSGFAVCVDGDASPRLLEAGSDSAVVVSKAACSPRSSCSLGSALHPAATSPEIASTATAAARVCRPNREAGGGGAVLMGTFLIAS